MGMVIAAYCLRQGRERGDEMGDFTKTDHITQASIERSELEGLKMTQKAIEHLKYLSAQLEGSPDVIMAVQTIRAQLEADQKTIEELRDQIDTCKICLLYTSDAADE